MIVAGYGVAALGFSTVLALCFIKWRERLMGVWFQLALLCSVLWAGYLSLDGAFEGFNAGNRVFVEIVRGVAWLLLVLKLFDHGRGGRDFWSLKPPWITVFVTLFLVLVNLLDVFLDGRLREWGVPLHFLAPLIYVTAILIVAEQWFRNIPLEDRWPVKLFLIGLGVCFLYDFVLFSEALLFNRLDPAFWQARGWVNAIAVPLIAVSAQRATEWNRVLRVSRHAIFFSTSLLLAGMYLLVMSLVGYYLKWFGSGFGNAIQIVFVVAGLALFVVLVTSGRVRSQIAVWLNKHFLSYKYEYRTEWMQANARLATLPMDDGYYQELLLGLAEPVGSQGGVLWIHEEDRLRPAALSKVQFDGKLSQQEASDLVGFMESTGWVINLKEYRSSPNLYRHTNIPEMLLSEQFWLLVPLMYQGKLVGLVGLAPPLVDQPVNWEDFDLLKALGEQLAAMIELKRTSDSLAEARQFEAYNQLSTFVVHDIKNVVAQLSLVVKNSERHRDNPEFIDDALATLSNAVKRMNRMLSQLKQRAEQGPLVLVDAAEVATEVVANQQVGKPKPELQTSGISIFIRADRERLVAALCHLVQNAQDATSDDGWVKLSVTKKEGIVEFNVSDCGVGMEQTFIEQSLFKPFVSSKGRAGMGIGVFEAREFARSSGGDLKVVSNVDEGSVFTLVLPLAEAETEDELSGVACGHG